MRTANIVLAALSVALLSFGCGDDGDGDSTTVPLGSVTLPMEGFTGGEANAPAFDLEGVQLNTYYDPEFGVSNGFTISRLTDTTTPGFMNAFSAYPGLDADGDGQFAIWNPPFDIDAPAIEFPTPSTPLSVQVANNTYAALSMEMGDQFAKQFTREDQDFFKVTFIGVDDTDTVTDTIEHYLADFRTETAPGIQSAWVELDLSALGSISALEIEFESSDVGSFGINTPLYVAIDQLVYR